jgi:transposase
MAREICPGCVGKDVTIERQTRRIRELEARVTALEGWIAKTSANSHKAPSSDGPAKVLRTRSERRRSGKKPGGQRGHPGTTLRKSPTPDRRVRHAVKACATCGRDLSHQKSDVVEERQVVDLPPVKMLCTAHEVERKTCPCGTVNHAPWPIPLSLEPGAVIYGPEIRALGVYLLQGQLLPYDRTSKLLKDLTGHPISVGTLAEWTQKASERLVGTDRNLADTLARSRGPVHFDETGIRHEGHNGWLHSASTEQVSHFAFHPKRGAEAMNAIGILPRFQGTAVHDRWEAYFGYGDCRHGLCGAHLLRDLRFVWEQEGERWAKNLRRLLGHMTTTVRNAKEHRQRRFNAPTLAYWTNRYRRILATGFHTHQEKNRREGPLAQSGTRGRKKQRPGKNLLDALQEHETSVLRFLHDFTVPFTNNQGERDIRMNKVKMKISGCFRSAHGAKDFCRIRSYLSTARKQGWSLLLALQSVFLGQPLQPTPASTG